jgi:sec-independent protein translocase protein TatB
MLSVPHLIILFIVVLVVFGPHKLPELARSLGKLMAEFRKASTDFKYAFEEEMRNIERQAREAEIKKAQAAVAAAANTPALPSPSPSAEETLEPGRVIDVEPVIRPNSEAVARSAEEIAPAAPASEGADTSQDPEAAEKLHDQQRSA